MQDTMKEPLRETQHNTEEKNGKNGKIYEEKSEEYSEVHKENREYKDSVFVDLFYSDETAKENVLSLYNALHGTELKDPEQIHLMKVDDVLYKNFKNDISFEVSGQLFVFGEHQSTVNVNIPLRCLMYAGRVYERLVDPKNRYRKDLIMIPAPEFFVFYNGEEDAPLEEELRLSAAYQGPAGKNSLELTVRVININTEKGHEILKKCRVLGDYSLLVDIVRRNQKKKISAPVKEAVRECIKKGILAEYLVRKGSEVENMLTAEYDYETDIQVNREEARADGWNKGWNNGWSNGWSNGWNKGILFEKVSSYRKMYMRQMSAADIADMLEEPLDFVNEIFSYFTNHPDWDDQRIVEKMTGENLKEKMREEQ